MILRNVYRKDTAECCRGSVQRVGTKYNKELPPIECLGMIIIRKSSRLRNVVGLSPVSIRIIFRCTVAEEYMSGGKLRLPCKYGIILACCKGEEGVLEVQTRWRRPGAGSPAPVPVRRAGLTTGHAESPLPAHMHRQPPAHPIVT